VGKTKAKPVLLQISLVHSAHFSTVTVDFELVETLVGIQPEIAEVKVSRLNVTLLGRSLRRSSHHHQALGRLGAQEYKYDLLSIIAPRFNLGGTSLK
jgi:hypothetical protein